MIPTTKRDKKGFTYTQPDYFQTSELVEGWKDEVEMASTTSQMRTYHWKDVIWTLRIFRLPHSNPSKDKIQLQLSRNVTITQFHLRMSWCDAKGHRYIFDMNKSDVFVKHAFPRYGQQPGTPTELLIEVWNDKKEIFQDKEAEDAARIWMDEVEGAEGMTREQNWWLLKNRANFFFVYDNMLPGTSDDKQLRWRWPRRDDDYSEMERLEWEMPTDADEYNNMWGICATPWKFAENDPLKPPKLSRGGMTRVERNCMRKFKQSLVEEEVPPEIKLSAEELEKEEKRKERNRKTKESKKAKKKEEGKEKEEKEQMDEKELVDMEKDRKEEKEERNVETQSPGSLSRFLRQTSNGASAFHKPA